MNGLDGRMKLLMWVAGGACAVIVIMQGVIMTKLSSVEGAMISGQISSAELKLRIQNLEKDVTEIQQMQRRVPERN